MNASAPLRLAVFDCDGTLVDSEKSIAHCMGLAFEGHGLDDPGSAAVRRMVGLPLIEAVAQLAPHVSAAAHARLRDSYIEHFASLRAANQVHEPLYDGIEEVLHTFDGAGYLLGVATGKALKGLVNTLNTHDLHGRFVTLQTADKARGKPHPEMLLNAMSETGAEADQTVMVGDTTYDMAMARNAGTVAIGVTWGYHEKRDLLDAGAHTVVDARDELFAVVEDLLKA